MQKSAVYLFCLAVMLPSLGRAAAAETEEAGHQIIYVKQSSPTEIIIDNDETGTMSSGEWELREYDKYYGGTLRVSPHGGGEGDSYTFEIDADGTVQVSLMWYDNDTWGSDEVYVEISDSGSLLNTIRVNQRHNGSKWNDMGTYDFTGKAKLVITKADIMWASVDAAKFTYAGPPGSSWHVPFDNLTDALTTAADGDEIWVAAGTYIPGSSAGDTFGVQPDVQLFGGFVGDETGREQRDWYTNETMLSGNGVCSHVLVMTEGSVVDGFIITGGNSDTNGAGVYISSGTATVANCTVMENSAAFKGGAVFVDTTGGAEINSCFLCLNDAAFGAAVSCEASLPVSIENCILWENSAATEGAAIWVGDANLSMENCIVSENFAPAGAGVLCSEGTRVDVKNCTIAHNRAIQIGGGIACDSNCAATITNCILWGNLADDGPQVALRNGGGSYPAVRVHYSDVQGGLSEIHNGGGVDYGPGNLDLDPLFAGGDMPVARWKFDEQTGLTVYDSVSENHGSIIGAQRTSGVLGGALYFDGADDYVFVPFVSWPQIGTGDFSISAWINPSALAGDRRMILADQALDNFQFNIDNGGTEAKIEIRLGGNITPVTSGSLTWDLGQWYHVAVRRTGGIVALYRNGVSVGMKTSFEYVDMSTSASIGYRPWTTVKHPFSGIIDDVRVYDRALSTAEIEDMFYLTVPDYHLESAAGRFDPGHEEWVLDAQTSRCIDAGNPGSPLGDEPLSEPNDLLTQNLRVNMGAYGGTIEASMAPHGWALLADLNNDGLVNGRDYAYQAQDWRVSGEELFGDLDRTSMVDMNDIRLLTDDWLKTTVWKGL